MTEQEKFGSNREQLRKYFEDSLTKSISKLREIIKNHKESTQYKQNKESQGQCSMEGLLADMSKDLEKVKRAKT